MPRTIDPIALEHDVEAIIHKALNYLLSPPAAYEFMFLILAVVLGYGLGRLILKFAARSIDKMRPESARLVRIDTIPALCCAFVWFVEWLLQLDGFETNILDAAGSLLLAWVAVRVVSCIVFSQFWSKVVSIFLWIFASLNIVGLLKPLIEITERFGFTLGDVRVSLPMMVKASVFLFILSQLGLWMVSIIERKLEGFQELSASNRVLIVKLLKALILIMAVVATLDEVGIDLGALAVLTGAIGVGLGFGLQKIIANLISGFILLSDKSLRPGDVIQIDKVYGWITKMSARYTLVATRDGTEFLIPNEEFITSKVINWSHSNPNMRLKLPVGIAYGSDLHLAKDIMYKAASSTERVLAKPAPGTRLRKFGDNSIDLELRIWIADPENGTSRIIDAILTKIYDGFEEAGIEIPFPQRDVRVKMLPGDEG